MRLPVCLVVALTVLPFLPAQQVAMIDASKDNTLFMHPPGGFSNGIGTGIFAGVNANARPRRAVLAFDVAGAVPAGATVVSVMLQLTVNQTISGPVNMSLHPISQDWGEGTSNSTSMGGGGGAPSTNGDATWAHTFFPNQFWTNPGGDFNATASATTPVAAIGQYFWSSAQAPQLIADVQGWLNNPAGNFGWLLKSPETGASTAKRFASREHPNVADRPRLVVGYTTGGPSVTSTGTGCAIGPGVPPFTLGTNGLPSVPNPAFQLTLVSGFPAGLGSIYLAQGLAPAPIPVGNGCNILLDVASALALEASGLSPIGPLPLDGAGALTLPVPLPNDPSLIGQSLDLQALTISLATGGFATSNAVTLQFG